MHTPEFSFEHTLDNVQQAATSMQVDYPIAIDNNYAIWDAFQTGAGQRCTWRMQAGVSNKHHFGEGAYDESE